jgi:hypothetical protein
VKAPDGGRTLTPLPPYLSGKGVSVLPPSGAAIIEEIRGVVLVMRPVAERACVGADKNAQREKEIPSTHLHC